VRFGSDTSPPPPINEAIIQLDFVRTDGGEVPPFRIIRNIVGQNDQMIFVSTTGHHIEHLGPEYYGEVLHYEFEDEEYYFEPPTLMTPVQRGVYRKVIQMRSKKEYSRRSKGTPAIVMGGFLAALWVLPKVFGRGAG
jgi:hypothetical protein